MKNVIGDEDGEIGVCTIDLVLVKALFNFGREKEPALSGPI